jgi:hypothetical protein
MSRLTDRSWNPSIDGRALIGRLARYRVEILVGLGLIVRLLAYLQDRAFWMDEASLARNIVGVSAWSGPRGLSQEQLAPFGFLVAERAVAGLLGGSRLALRLIPLASGMVSVVLFARVARRCLRRPARSVAVALFALSVPLNYYSSELKPYAGDVAAMLACWLLALPLHRRRPLSPAWAAAAAGEAALVWFSFPVVFGLAGVGLVWLAALIRRRRPGAILAAIGTCLLWALSFAASVTVARRLLGPAPGMWVFWNFAFPPRDPSALAWIGRRILNVFSNPMHFRIPLGLPASCMLAAALAGIGAGSLMLRRPAWLARQLLPILVVLAAAWVRAYPFHGRLLLFLLPALYLWTAEGLAALADAAGAGRITRAAVIVIVFLWPVAESLQAILEPFQRNFDPHGDLWPNPFL